MKPRLTFLASVDYPHDVPRIFLGRSKTIGFSAFSVGEVSLLIAHEVERHMVTGSVKPEEFVDR